MAQMVRQALFLLGFQLGRQAQVDQLDRVVQPLHGFQQAQQVLMVL